MPFRESIVRLLVVATLVLAVAPFQRAQSATSSNAQSPLGANLASPNQWATNDPFLNLFVCNNSWITSSSSTWDTGEEADLELDSNGYPTSLVANPVPSGGQRFAYVQVSLNCGASSGQYTVKYQGTGTMTFRLGAAVVSSSAGQYIVSYTAANGPFVLEITATDPNHTGDYIRNISVVPSALQSSYVGGQIFNPDFLALIQNFRALRFMDWFLTNTNTLSSWNGRPLQTNAFWGGPNGVPIEVAVQLANEVAADAWLNVPTQADANYISQMATLVHNLLGRTQKVYLEYSNEVWNGAFTQYQYAITQGQATFPSGLGSPYDYNRNWYGMHVAQICDTWKSIWGADASRVICVMGAQAASTYAATESLSTPFWTGAGNGPAAAHGIGAIAIAPYFGTGGTPASWTSDAGLNALFAAMTTQNDPSIPQGGLLSQASGWESSYASVAHQYNLPVIAYEGGQSLVPGSNAELQALYFAANRDPRMATAYSSYFQQWKANGGQLFMIYNDIQPYGSYGEWGALESIQQVVSPLSSAPPKWQAIQNFISEDSCWWSGCVGTISSGAVPKAPSNVIVK